MAEHVIVSFTYNCNNDALVRVLNYLFIVSCFERTSHLNKWPGIVRPKGLMKAFAWHKDNASDAARACYGNALTLRDVSISIDPRSFAMFIKEGACDWSDPGEKSRTLPRITGPPDTFAFSR